MVDSEPNSGFAGNPYAPTASSGVQDQLTREAVRASRDEYVPSTLQWTAFRWFSICSLCAAPSFLLGWGITNGRYDAMVSGIFIFALGFTLLDYFTSRQSWRRKRLIRRTLRTMYGTRIAITLLFPIGYFLDVYCGIISIGLTQAVVGTEFMMDGRDHYGFAPVLLTTLIQGTVMNMVVGVYGLFVLTLMGIVHALRR